ncbi:hypothetical protein LCGC14_1650270 [marine sediment metagenome]|uniref:Uncharacterized protein n=1 Tax=marine sediment metagenome TaxID=412755 RepID=A0A0F9IJI2_9ZZZZ
MKVIIRVYDGELSSGAKQDILDALELDDLLLTGELNIPAGAGGDDIHDGFHELTFEEEVVDAEVDVPEEEPE